MSTLSFVKYQGAGNDFVLIDDRSRSFPSHNQPFIQKLCCRRFGIGADGLLLLSDDFTSDFRMRIFNSDGVEAESCGNGLRCFAQFICDLGFPKKNYRIALENRIVEVWFEKDLVAVDMGPIQNLQMHLSTEIGAVHFVNTGVPHVVHFVPNIHDIDLLKIGFFLRNHSKFQPKGTNVNVASLDPWGNLHARTFERGVEGETFACGTGALAVAFIASEVYGLKMPLEVCFKGGNLIVDKQGDSMHMIGPAVKVYDGIWPRIPKI